MAACDNLYGDRKKWKELRDFLRKHHMLAVNYMRPTPPEEGEEVRICYIADIQGWLMENCPLDWVKEQLKDNFGVQEFICGEPHHLRKDVSAENHY